jgi:hypothetical protein
MIDKEQLLKYAKQMLKEHKFLMKNDVLDSDYKQGIKVGMDRLIKLIERQ